MSTKTTKTTMKRWLTPVVVPAVVMMVALGTLVVADAAAAQPRVGRGARAGRMGRGGGPPLGGQLMHLRALDLSEAQQEQIRTMGEQSGEAIQAAAEQARQALHDATIADVVSEGQIHVAAAALGTAEGEAAVHRAYLHAQVWQLLTPEQQVAAREAEAEMARRRGQRRQRMGERRERRQQRQQQQGLGATDAKAG